MIDFDSIEQHVEWSFADIDQADMQNPRYQAAWHARSLHDSPDETGQPLSTMHESLKDQLLQLFMDRCDLPGDWDYLGVQKYETGDYIPPHTDSWPWHRLLMLTTSDVDGLVLHDAGQQRFIFHPDQAGNIINIPPMTTHWVNPVRQSPRYTAVIGSQMMNLV
jgi:hypothetical protein